MRPDRDKTEMQQLPGTAEERGRGGTTIAEENRLNRSIYAASLVSQASLGV